MSKAKQFADHCFSAAFKGTVPGECGPIQARVTYDGTLSLHVPQMSFMYTGGISPEAALELGRWLVDMYEDKDEKAAP